MEMSKNQRVQICWNRSSLAISTPSPTSHITTVMEIIGKSQFHGQNTCKPIVTDCDILHGFVLKFQICLYKCFSNATLGTIIACQMSLLESLHSKINSSKNWHFRLALKKKKTSYPLGKVSTTKNYLKKLTGGSIFKTPPPCPKVNRFNIFSKSYSDFFQFIYIFFFKVFHHTFA